MNLDTEYINYDTFMKKGYGLIGSYISFSKNKEKRYIHIVMHLSWDCRAQVSQHLNYIADHLGIFMERLILIQSNQVGQCSLSRQKKGRPVLLKH